jgi:hypothetical protein
MVLKKGPMIFQENPSFEAVLNSAFERLWGKKVQYSIRRIQEMDGYLQNLEKELDELIRQNRLK